MAKPIKIGVDESEYIFGGDLYYLYLLFMWNYGRKLHSLTLSPNLHYFRKY